MENEKNLYFVALLLTKHIAEDMDRYKEMAFEKFGLKHAKKSPPHITLVSPFLAASEEVEEKIKFLEKFFNFELKHAIVLDSFDHFEKRTIFIKIEKNRELDGIYRKIKEEGAEYFKFTSKPFIPHITIINRDLKNEHFENVWSYFKDIKYKNKFKVLIPVILKHNGEKWEVFKKIKIK